MVKKKKKKNELIRIKISYTEMFFKKKHCHRVTRRDVEKRANTDGSRKPKWDMYVLVCVYLCVCVCMCVYVRVSGEWVSIYICMHACVHVYLSRDHISLFRSHQQLCPRSSNNSTIPKPIPRWKIIFIYKTRMILIKQTSSF